MKSKFKGSRLQLLFKINHHHRALTVVVFLEVWHGSYPLIVMPNFIKKVAYFWSFSTASTLSTGARGTRVPRPKGVYRCVLLVERWFTVDRRQDFTTANHGTG